jgi:acyl dehydratase
VSEGDEFETSGRTVTVADIVNYCGVSGDFHPFHIDDEFASSTGFGQRVAHGAMITAFAVGLFSRLHLFDDTAIGLVEETWKYRSPAFIGDTVTVGVRLHSVTRSRTKPDRGVVVIDLTVRNQRGQVVQEGTWTEMVRCHPAGAGAPAAQSPSDG